jgi:hypothetical protein
LHSWIAWQSDRLQWLFRSLLDQLGWPFSSGPLSGHQVAVIIFIAVFHFSILFTLFGRLPFLTWFKFLLFADIVAQFAQVAESQCTEEAAHDSPDHLAGLPTGVIGLVTACESSQVISLFASGACDVGGIWAYPAFVHNAILG